MTPLSQQLEDKKKGCGKSTKWSNGYYTCGGFEDLKHSDHYIYCNKCQAEIAILEQAIAEMQKQRQEILDWIKEHEFTQNQGGYLIYADDLEVYIKQLNQPKTEE